MTKVLGLLLTTSISQWIHCFFLTITFTFNFPTFCSIQVWPLGLRLLLWQNFKFSKVFQLTFSKLLFLTLVSTITTKSILFLEIRSLTSFCFRVLLSPLTFHAPMLIIRVMLRWMLQTFFIRTLIVNFAQILSLSLQELFFIHFESFPKEMIIEEALSSIVSKFRVCCTP